MSFDADERVVPVDVCGVAGTYDTALGVFHFVAATRAPERRDCPMRQTAGAGNKVGAGSNVLTCNVDNSVYL